MINGQNMGDVAKIRYGLFPMSFNGCEVISVCNALEYCGKPQEVKAVAKYMFRYSMLFGFFGCNPYFIGSALKHFGIESKRCDKNSAGKHLYCPHGRESLFCQQFIRFSASVKEAE